MKKVTIEFEKQENNKIVLAIEMVDNNNMMNRQLLELECGDVVELDDSGITYLA